MFIASSEEVAIPFFGWRIFKLDINFWNLSLSSARSIASWEVPKILISILLFSNSFASFKGVCPPNWTIIPNKFPDDFSILIISIRSSKLRGSKYNLSEVS